MKQLSSNKAIVTHKLVKVDYSTRRVFRYTMYMYVPPMLPRNRNLLTQNVLSHHFSPHIRQQHPMSNEQQSVLSYARPGRGVQGESVNGGSNLTNIAVRRRDGFTR